MELDELLRRHLAEDEPGGPMLPGPVIARGRRSVRNRRITAGAVCVVVIGSAAAIAAPRLGSPDADGGTDPANVTGVEYRSPISEVVQGGRDWVTWNYDVRAAEVEAWNACAADAGVSQRRIPPDRTHVELQALDLAYGTPLHDDAFRSAHGYGLTDDAFDTRYLEDTAWMDAPREVLDTCQAATEHDPQAAAVAGAWLESTLTVQAQLVEDPGVVRALDAWESCMAERGHRFTNPLDPSGVRNPWNVIDRKLDDQGRSDALHAEEIAVADADWACRVAHLNEVYDATRRRLEQEYVDAHPDEANGARAAAERLMPPRLSE